MEQVTVTGNENTRIEVVSISEIHKVIKIDEIPKAWSPLWSMDYSMMGKRKAPVVWIYLMNLPAGVYFSSEFEPQHLTGLCGLEFSFVDEPDVLCAELGKDNHVRMASVNQDPSSSVTAFVCIPAVNSFQEHSDYHDALRDEYRAYGKASESGKSHMHTFALLPYAGAVLNEEATPLKF